MATIQDLEKEIESIRQRNKKVESDKAWETSLSRNVVIAVLLIQRLEYIFMR